MPIYQYICEPDIKGCGHEFEEIQSMGAEPLKKCPQCKKKKLRKVFSTFTPVGEPKTVGSLADKNASKLSDEQKAEIRPDHYKPEVKQWWGRPDKELIKKIRNASDKERKKYVATGKI